MNNMHHVGHTLVKWNLNALQNGYGLLFWTTSHAFLCTIA